MAQREWKEIRKFEEILFEEYHGIAKITINRPRYRNAFTPKTTLELSQAFALCREMQNIRVVLLTGAGDKAFCSGGDMHVKGRGGYVDDEGVPRLSVLDVQMQIRRLPKPVIAMVNGYAIGGGHVLHLVCELTIASEKAIFGHFFDGRVTAVLGTHTHVATNDAHILEGGTAFQSDVGMCGDPDGVIGFEKESVINRIVYGEGRFELNDKARMMINAVLIDVDELTYKATAITPIVSIVEK